MTGRKVKKPAKSPDNLTETEIELAVKVVTQQRLYHELEKELHGLKKYVEGCQK